MQGVITMNAETTFRASEARPSTLVWIDAREAVILRLDKHRARIARVESEVPAHHRATGHVRHDPGIRHGGGGPRSAGEPHRIEHLDLFVAGVAGRLAAGDDLLILGPGTVHERLARQLSQIDGRHGDARRIACEASPPMTDRQLVARLRRFAGVEQRRHSVGAYRWSQATASRRSGHALVVPRGVVNKRAPDRHLEAAKE